MMGGKNVSGKITNPSLVNQPITFGGWNIKVDGKTTNPSFLGNQPQPIEEGSNGWESDTDQGGKYQFPCKIII